MVETKSNALPLERGKALPAQIMGSLRNGRETSRVQGDVNTQNTGSGNSVCKPAKTVYITQKPEYIYSLTVKTPPMIKA